METQVELEVNAFPAIEVTAHGIEGGKFLIPVDQIAFIKEAGRGEHGNTIIQFRGLPGAAAVREHYHEVRAAYESAGNKIHVVSGASPENNGKILA